MWNTLRYALERRGLLRPAQDRLTVHGRIRSADQPGTGTRTMIHVRPEDGPGDVIQLEADSHFTLVLPLRMSVHLTITRPDHLPRMVEIRSLRTALLFARGRVHSSCEIDVVLTSCLATENGTARPLLERIIMPKGLKPLIVEWDHVPRPVREHGFEPLFARAF